MDHERKNYVTRQVKEYLFLEPGFRDSVSKVDYTGGRILKLYEWVIEVYRHI